MTKYLLTALTTIALCCSRSGLTQTAPTQSKSTDKVHAGQELFTQKCFQCHSVVEGQVRFGPSLYHVAKPPHKTAAQIRVIITNGKGKMPPFKESLTQENVDDLIAYVRSL